MLTPTLNFSSFSFYCSFTAFYLSSPTHALHPFSVVGSSTYSRNQMCLVCHELTTQWTRGHVCVCVCVCRKRAYFLCFLFPLLIYAKMLFCLWHALATLFGHCGFAGRAQSVFQGPSLARCCCGHSFPPPPPAFSGALVFALWHCQLFKRTGTCPLLTLE